MAPNGAQEKKLLPYYNTLGGTPVRYRTAWPLGGHGSLWESGSTGCSGKTIIGIGYRVTRLTIRAETKHEEEKEEEEEQAAAAAGSRQQQAAVNRVELNRSCVALTAQSLR